MSTRKSLIAAGLLTALAVATGVALTAAPQRLDADKIGHAAGSKPITTVAIPEDIDDLFYDAKHKRLYASCGEGFLTVLRQRDADTYDILEKIPTVKLARTCLFDPVAGRLYLGLPRQEGQEGPQIQVYEARP